MGGPGRDLDLRRLRRRPRLRRHHSSCWQRVLRDWRTRCDTRCGTRRGTRGGRGRLRRSGRLRCFGRLLLDRLEGSDLRYEIQRCTGRGSSLLRGLGLRGSRRSRLRLRGLRRSRLRSSVEFLGDGLEAKLRDLDAVMSRRHIRQTEAAVLVGPSDPRPVAGSFDQAQRCARDRSAIGGMQDTAYGYRIRSSWRRGGGSCGGGSRFLRNRWQPDAQRSK